MTTQTRLFQMLCSYSKDNSNFYNFFRRTFLQFFFLSLALSVNGQKESRINKFLSHRGYDFPESGKKNLKPGDEAQWPDVLYYNTRYTSGLLGTSTIPVSFSRAEFKDKEYKIGASLNFGYGYTWFFGDFTFEENDKISVDPEFFFGVAADIGLKNDFDTGKATGSFVTGAFIGMKSFSLFGGYDFLSQSPTLGLGARIDLYTLSSKNLKPYGKVRAVRTPKPGAKPIPQNN